MRGWLTRLPRLETYQTRRVAFRVGKDVDPVRAHTDTREDAAGLCVCRVAVSLVHGCADLVLGHRLV